jgi:hypothetical protein
MKNEFKYIADHLDQLSDTQLLELERRLRRAEENPGEGLSWEGDMDEFEKRHGFQLQKDS